MMILLNSEKQCIYMYRGKRRRRKRRRPGGEEIWKKSKLNSEKIWKIQKKCKLNSENIEDFDVSHNYTQRDLLLLSIPPFPPLLPALLLLSG
jgi:hypothetical protein